MKRVSKEYVFYAFTLFIFVFLALDIFTLPKKAYRSIVQDKVCLSKERTDNRDCYLIINSSELRVQDDDFAKIDIGDTCTIYRGQLTNFPHNVGTVSDVSMNYYRVGLFRLWIAPLLFLFLFLFTVSVYIIFRLTNNHNIRLAVAVASLFLNLFFLGFYVFFSV